MSLRIQAHPALYTRSQTPAPGLTVKRAAVAIGALLAGLPRAAGSPLHDALNAPAARGVQLQPRADVTKTHLVTETVTATITKTQTIKVTETTTATKTRTTNEVQTATVTKTKVGATVTVPAATVTNPAPTVTVTLPPSTVTLPASTVTGSGVPLTNTVTVTASQSACSASSSATPHVNYYGGPVIGAPSVFTLFWNNKVNYQTQLGLFYGHLVENTFMSKLAEYSTPNTEIVAGSIAGSFVDTQPTTSTVTSDQIVAEIAAKIDSQVIKVTPNTLVAVHFPPSISITANGQQSCLDFCSYSGAFVHGGQNVYYTVVADTNPICCRIAESTDPQQLLTLASSQAFIDAVTNPAVSLVPGEDLTVPPSAWLSPQDAGQFVTGLCNDVVENLPSTNGAYSVQGLWSDNLNACI